MDDIAAILWSVHWTTYQSAWQKFMLPENIFTTFCLARSGVSAFLHNSPCLHGPLHLFMSTTYHSLTSLFSSILFQFYVLSIVLRSQRSFSLLLIPYLLSILCFPDWSSCMWQCLCSCTTTDWLVYTIFASSILYTCLLLISFLFPCLFDHALLRMTLSDLVYSPSLFFFLSLLE